MVTPYYSMRNRQVSSAISLQSNYLLEFLFTRHKLNWKLIWCCLPCWERRTIFSASITFLFCIIFGDLKNRWQSIPITHLFWTQTGLFFFLTDHTFTHYTHLKYAPSDRRIFSITLESIFVFWNTQKSELLDHDDWAYTKFESLSVFGTGG